MRVLFIVRSTLFSVKGGDTVQVDQTARELKKLGVDVVIKLTNEKMDYHSFDLLHFFNLGRPADILVHIKRSGKPFVITPILVNYALYDKKYRKGIAGILFRFLSPGRVEYLKTVYRAILGKDSLASKSYLWKGHQRSITWILLQTSCVLVNAQEEYDELAKRAKTKLAFEIIANGTDSRLFRKDESIVKDLGLVLCVARIEGIKNQINLIRAVRNSPYKLLLIGDAAPNQHNYFRQCKRLAGENVSFIPHLAQEQLVTYYAKAKVHVLPSWFEVCGLSSLEAAVMGCQVVITDHGYARSYFKEDAFYCDPANPVSILQAIDKASRYNDDGHLQNRIGREYSWGHAAERILSVYKKYIS